MKKRVNIILLLVVLTLWGTVAWRSLKNFLHQPEEVKNTTLYQSINLNKIKKDTFVLKRLNRDPFLHKSISSTTTNFKNSKKSLKKIKLFSLHEPTSKKKELSKMPIIKYIGYIKSTNKKDEMVILKINEVIKRIDIGKKNNDIIVKRIFKDSIKIVYLDKLITVKK